MQKRRFVERVKRSLKALGRGAIALAAASSLVWATTIPNIPSNPTFNEPSQIVATLNTLINQLNGFGGYTGLPQIIPLGQYCTASGATPQTCNGQRGAVTFTSGNGLATGATATQVITNSFVTAASTCTVTINSAGTAGSGLVAATATPSAGSLSVVEVNAGTTTNAVTNVTFGFNCVN